MLPGGRCENGFPAETYEIKYENKIQKRCQDSSKPGMECLYHLYNRVSNRSLNYFFRKKLDLFLCYVSSTLTFHGQFTKFLKNEIQTA